MWADDFGVPAGALPPFFRGGGGARAGRVDFLRRFPVWADDLGFLARPPPPFLGFWGRAGVLDFLGRFRAWADDFGVPDRLTRPGRCVAARQKLGDHTGPVTDGHPLGFLKRRLQPSARPGPGGHPNCNCAASGVSPRGVLGASVRRFSGPAPTGPWALHPPTPVLRPLPSALRPGAPSQKRNGPWPL